MTEERKPVSLTTAFMSVSAVCALTVVFEKKLYTR